MNFIIYLIVGGIAGWLASILMRTDGQQGILLNIVVGIIGGFIGGWLLPMLGLGLGDPLVIEQLLDERVVLGDLAEGALAQQVGPGVADVGHRQLVPRAQHGDRRGPHSGQTTVLAHRGAQLGIGFA